MAEHSTREALIGLGKESSRGTEASSLAVSLPADPDSEFDYVPVYVEDEKLRGVKDQFAPTMVAKEGTGSLSAIPVEPLTIGYLLESLMGSSSSALVSTSLAYQHTFTRLAGVQLPSYTFVKDRSVGKKGYLLGVVSQMALNVGFREKVMADFDVLFKEEAVSALSIPAVTEPAPFNYPNVDIFMDDEGASKPGSQNAEIRELTLTINNQSMGKDALNGSMLINDVVTPDLLLINGTFTVYMTSEDERDDLLNGQTKALWIDMTGALIEETYYNKLEVIIPKIVYTAVPYGDVDGMLAAAVAFNAYYRVADAKSISLLLTNTDTSY